MRTKRLLVVATHFAPHVGGVESYTRACFAALAQAYPGVQVTVLTLGAPGRVEREEMDGLSVIRVPRLGTFDVNPFFWPPSVRRVLTQLGFAEYDAVVTQCRYYFFTNYLSWLARRRGLRLVHIEHNAGFMVHQSRLFTVLAYLYDRLVSGRVLRRADRVVAVSDEVRRFLRRAFGIADARTVYAGVSLQAWPWHRRGADRSLVYCGRLLEAKGVFRLLEAFQALAAAVPTLELVYAGDGPAFVGLRRRVDEAGLEGRVRLVGRQEQTALRGYLREAALFVYPTSYPEGLPMALLEAGAAGVPIVATRAGGIQELIQDGHSGTLVAEDEPLAPALQRLLAAPAERQRQAEALRETIEARFSLEQNVRQLYGALFA